MPGSPLNVNSVTLVGRLTRDPVLRSLPDRPSVCEPRLAVNDTNDREGREQPLFIDVATFGKGAEACAKHLAKGRQAAVTSRLRYSRWQTEDGAPRSKHSVVGRVTFGQQNGSEADHDDHPAD